MIQAKLGAIKDFGPLDGERVLILYIRTSDPDAIKAMAPGYVKIAPKRGRGRPRLEKKK